MIDTALLLNNGHIADSFTPDDAHETVQRITRGYLGEEIAAVQDETLS
jgi:hypothetical protein